MEPDAATYAIISMEMLDRGDWQITARGLDWLDKPHLPFWITALSMKIFGVNNLGYKIPAILFTLIGALYTFRFAAHFYSKKHGYLAVMLLLTSLHLILSNNDVRAEPFLLGQTIFSLYYFAKLLERWSWRDLILGSLGLALLMMTKGLFTIIPVAGAVFFQLVYSRKWKQIFHWQWILVAFITLIFMAPVLISYYLQFDLHPEKTIFGLNNVSGLKFFFWDSQWGRFTNSGPITGQGDIFFFLHTILWAYAPWAIILYIGSFQFIKKLFRNNQPGESYTFFGFVFMILVFSISKFQLPHYIVPLFPFLSIFCAEIILRQLSSNRFYKSIKIAHGITGILLFVIVGLLHYYFDQNIHWDTLLLAIIILGLSMVALVSQSRLVASHAPVALSVLFSMYYMNREFYPKLMKYQSESEVAFYLENHKIPAQEVSLYGRNSWVTDFYVHYTLPVIHEVNNLHGYVFVNEEGLKELDAVITYEVIQTFPDFHVTTLSPEFINHTTRKETLQNNYLIRIN